MNCKQGDLAIFVKSKYGNIGRIVTCIRLATKADFIRFSAEDPQEPAWLVDIYLHGSIHDIPLARDGNLRPIRDSDGQDETLTWQPVPKKEKA